MNKNNKANQAAESVAPGKGGFRAFIGRLARIAPGRRPVPGDSGSTSEKKKRPEKRPLQRDITPAKEFPVDALGPVLGDATRAIEYAIQAPMAICGSSVLAVAHLAAQPHANVEVDGRISPLSGFFVTVGGSGERKTAVDKAALREVRSVEKNIQESYSDITQLRGNEHDMEPRTKKYARTSRDASVSGDAGKLLGISALPPLSPVFICEEPTLEGLVKNLTVGHPSQGLFSDEGGRFLSGFSMSDENMTATLAGFSKLWDGSPLDRVRAGDGALKLYGRRLSFHLMVQPQVASALMGNSRAQDQGFLSRCLVTMPVSTVGKRFYREKNLNDEAALEVFHSRIRYLLTRSPTVDDATDLFRRSQLAPRALPLSTGAKAVYMAFHDDVERGMTGRFSELRAFANKGPEHLLRIAGVLAIIEDIDALEISQAHAENARTLVEYYLEEARRIDEMARQDTDLETAQRLLEWLQEQARPVSLVEIYQNGPKTLRSAKRAKHFLHILAEHGYIIPVKGISYRNIPRDEGWKLIA